MYIGKVISVSQESYIGSFLRKKETKKDKMGHIYYFPDVPDETEFTKDQIIKRGLSFKERRGLYIFENLNTKDYECLWSYYT